MFVRRIIYAIIDIESAFRETVVFSVEKIYLAEYIFENTKHNFASCSEQIILVVLWNSIHIMTHIACFQEKANRKFMLGKTLLPPPAAGKNLHYQLKASFHP